MMANGNPFFISPAASQGAMQGLGAIGSAFIQKQQQDQAQAAQQAAQQEIQGALGSGDVGKIQEVMVKYPQMAQAIQSSYNFASDATRQDIIDTSFDVLRDIYGGGTGQAAVQGRIDRLTGQVDLTQTREGLELAPEQLEQVAMLNLAVMAPEKLKAVQSLRQQAEAKPGQVITTGELVGYIFDPNTNQLSIDPEIEQALNQKAVTEAAEAAAADKVIDAKTRQGINKDVTALLKDAIGINTAAKDLAKLEEGSSPTDQLAAIFKFMKALDPTSVVREGEQQMARSTGGPADAFIGYINQLRGEGGLTPEAFGNMVTTAKNLSDSAVGSSQGTIQSYLDAYEDTLPQNFKNILKRRIPAYFQPPAKTAAETGQVQQAPPAAIQMLRENPALAEQFKQKYGYLPTEQELVGGTLPPNFQPFTGTEPGAF